MIYLVFAGLAVFFSVALHPCRARAEPSGPAGDNTPLSDAVLAAAPFPVFTLNGRTLEICGANRACSDQLHESFAPGADLRAFLPQEEFFVQFIRDILNDWEQKLPSRGAHGADLNKTCLVLWGHDNAGALPALLTVFYLYRPEGGDPLLSLCVQARYVAGQELMNTAFADSDDVLYLLDASRRFLQCNRAFERLFGGSQEFVRGKTVAELGLEPGLRALLQPPARNGAKDGAFLQTWTSSRENGRYFKSSLTADRSVDGAVQGYFGVCRDISTDRLSKETLKRQGVLLQASSDAAVMLFSEDSSFDDQAQKVLQLIGRVTGARRAGLWRNHGSAGNLMCTLIYGWSEEAGYVPSEKVPLNNVSYSLQLPGWEGILSRGDCVNTWVRDLKNSDVGRLSVYGEDAVLAAPILFNDQFWGFIVIGGSGPGRDDWSGGEEAILRSVGMLLAVSMQRWHIKVALLESEKRFQDVTAAAGELVWELDAEGCFSYVSGRVAEMFGYAPEEFLGMRWEDFQVDEDDEGVTGQMFQQSLSAGGFRGLEHRVRNKNGSPMWLLTSGCLLAGEEGIAGLRGTSQDITRSKETADSLNVAMKALEQANTDLELSAQKAYSLALEAGAANRAKSDFMANISHEIRTPLNAIIGMAYLALKTDLTARQRDYLEKINSAGTSLLGIVNDILDFSKIEAGRVDMETAPFDLEKLILKAASGAGSLITDQAIEIGFLLQPDVPRYLVGDAEHFSQVLGNILSNAVKFTPGGSVMLRCSLAEETGDEVRLEFSIQDTGIGMSAEQMSGLFTAFTQGDSSMTRRYGGSGLGLAIARNLVDLAGGTLRIESEEGKGTTVFIGIPFGLDKTKPLETGPALEGLPVLVAEESDLLGGILKEMLEARGCEVRVCQNLNQARTLVLKEDAGGKAFSVAVIGREMAVNVQGPDLRLILEGPGQKEPTKILGISDAPAGSHAPESYEHVDGWVYKPVVSFVLYSVIAGLLNTTFQQPEMPAPGKTDPPHFSGQRVLVVEDNAINQELAAELLKETGLEVDVASNGQEALNMLDSQPDETYSLVLMDIQMPVMDGFEATRALRAAPRYGSLPIIAMTAHATEEERQSSLAAGMNGHLSKPIDLAALYGVLLQWITPAQEAPGKDSQPEKTCPIYELPPLPGLDVETALRNLNYNEALYTTLLRQFWVNHSWGGVEMLMAFEEGRVEDGLRQVHTLKGLGGTIGAFRLAKMAADIEKAFEAGDPDVMNTRVMPFIAELSATTDMLERAFPQAAAPKAEQTASREELEAALARLRALLEDDDAEACKLFDSIEPDLSRIDSKLTAEAARGLAGFDFHAALDVVNRLSAILSKES